jgi:hypothetical protein
VRFTAPGNKLAFHTVAHPACVATIAAAEFPQEVTMTSWLKCTAKRGGEAVYVNLDNAVSVSWSERDKGTVIAFIGGEKDAVMVQEKPEEILSGR